ncbi:MAG: hypothetical protein JSS89_03715 [Bacteroidetes bacterium]|nr:hypothetical protein [Bacteroidota bacterium]
MNSDLQSAKWHHALTGLMILFLFVNVGSALGQGVTFKQFSIVPAEYIDFRCATTTGELVLAGRVGKIDRISADLKRDTFEQLPSINDVQQIEWVDGVLCATTRGGELFRSQSPGVWTSAVLPRGVISIMQTDRRYAVRYRDRIEIRNILTDVLLGTVSSVPTPNITVCIAVNDSTVALGRLDGIVEIWSTSNALVNKRRIDTNEVKLLRSIPGHGLLASTTRRSAILENGTTQWKQLLPPSIGSVVPLDTLANLYVIDVIIRDSITYLLAAPTWGYFTTYAKCIMSCSTKLSLDSASLLYSKPDWQDLFGMLAVNAQHEILGFGIANAKGRLTSASGLGYSIEKLPGPAMNFDTWTGISSTPSGELGMCGFFWDDVRWRPKTKYTVYDSEGKILRQEWLTKYCNNANIWTDRVLEYDSAVVRLSHSERSTYQSSADTVCLDTIQGNDGIYARSRDLTTIAFSGGFTVGRDHGRTWELVKTQETIRDCQVSGDTSIFLLTGWGTTTTILHYDSDLRQLEQVKVAGAWTKIEHVNESSMILSSSTGPELADRTRIQFAIFDRGTRELQVTCDTTVEANGYLGSVKRPVGSLLLFGGRETQFTTTDEWSHLTEDTNLIARIPPYIYTRSISTGSVTYFPGYREVLAVRDKTTSSVNEDIISLYVHRIWPVPTSDKINCRLQHAYPDDVPGTTVRLYTTHGAEVRDLTAVFQQSPHDGGITQFSFDTFSLNPGAYLLVFSSPRSTVARNVLIMR